MQIMMMPPMDRIRTGFSEWHSLSKDSPIDAA